MERTQDGDIQKQLRSYSERSLDMRSQWYSPAAIAYDKVRPQYPQALIQQVIERAGLSSQSSILEIGCGPGTATQSLAQLGASITAIEPNLDFHRLAKSHFEDFDHIEIQNTSFESFPLNGQKFDAVVAATSFHWIPKEISFHKSAQLLKDGGCLILLWNKHLQPSLPVYQSLLPIYEKHAPHVRQYEDRPTQIQILKQLGALITDSGYFYQLEFDSVETELKYSSEDYCSLLTTYSPYIQLDSTLREALLTELEQKIQTEFGGQLSLTYRSAMNLARKT